MWLEYRSGHLPVRILRNVRMVEEYEDDKSGILDVRLLHVAIRGVTRCLIQAAASYFQACVDCWIGVVAGVVVDAADPGRYVLRVQRVVRLRVWIERFVSTTEKRRILVDSRVYAVPGERFEIHLDADSESIGGKCLSEITSNGVDGVVHDRELRPLTVFRTDSVGTFDPARFGENSLGLGRVVGEGCVRVVRIAVDLGDRSGGDAAVSAQTLSIIDWRSAARLSAIRTALSPATGLFVGSERPRQSAD